MHSSKKSGSNRSDAVVWPRRMRAGVDFDTGFRQRVKREVSLLCLSAEPFRPEAP